MMGRDPDAATRSAATTVLAVSPVERPTEAAVLGKSNPSKLQLETMGGNPLSAMRSK